MEKKKIAYSGVQGAYGNIAAAKIFPDGEMISFSSFRKAYEAAESGECDYAVLPIENSYAGDVAQVTDLLYGGSLYIVGIYELPIQHNLLGIRGTTKEQITKVYSHPQALDQCGEYIYRNGFERRVATNTAVAAKEVALLKDPTMAAIASEETAKLYGLQILERSINESAFNTTRFVVLAIKNEPLIDTKEAFSMIMIVQNKAGAFAKAISAIGDAGYNMRAIHSRPMRSLAWSYYFYIEGEGDLTTDEGRQMLKNLEEYCERVSIIGNYATDRMLE